MKEHLKAPFSDPSSLISGRATRSTLLLPHASWEQDGRLRRAPPAGWGDSYLPGDGVKLASAGLAQVLGGRGGEAVACVGVGLTP